LQEGGVDLVQYRAKETALHLDGTMNSSFYILFSEYWILIELIAFSYGPPPSDWHFWFSEPTDVYAGEFWAMIETSACENELELPIPGVLSTILEDLRLRCQFYSSLENFLWRIKPNSTLCDTSIP
jgi:hypothetical protein